MKMHEVWSKIPGAHSAEIVSIGFFRDGDFVLAEVGDPRDCEFNQHARRFSPCDVTAFSYDLQTKILHIYLDGREAYDRL